MKTCYRCKRDLPLDQFYKNSTKPDGLTGYCKDCKRTYNSSHYQQTKDTYNPQRAATRLAQVEAVHDFLWDLLEVAECADCDLRDPIVMEFDHVRGVKKFNIANAKDKPLAKVEEEIEKCDIVCANCHRRRTLSRMPSSWRHSRMGP